VIMESYNPDDLAALGVLLESPARYVGLLGPSHRREKLLQDLAEQQGGRRATPAQLARLHGPVGVDCAAETPAEVAAAVVAEMLAARSARTAGFLRDLEGPIHDSTPRQGPVTSVPGSHAPTSANLAGE